MMLFTFVGLTAIDVSLCGPTEVVSQSVFAFGVACVAVVQIAVPVFTAGPDPNTALGTGAGALIALCVKSTGCGSSPPNATTLSTSAAPATGRNAAASRKACPLILLPFSRHGRLSAYDDFTGKAGCWFALTGITGDDSDLRELVEVDLPRRAVGGDVAEP